MSPRAASPVKRKKPAEGKSAGRNRSSLNERLHLMDSIKATKHDGLSAAERFWMKVDKTSTCWLWMAGTNGRGYGSFRTDDVADGAHRVAWQLLRGPIPDGLVLDHLCRVTLCVNPDHLEPVTDGENMRRGLKTYALRSTCKRGHDITEPGNVKVRPSGRRECRTCARASYSASPAALRRKGAAA